MSDPKITLKLTYSQFLLIIRALQLVSPKVGSPAERAMEHSEYNMLEGQLLELAATQIQRWSNKTYFRIVKGGKHG